MVYRGSAFHDNGYDPGGVLLVAEVVSPSSVTLDRITKPAVYAERGIPFYWRIEAEPRFAMPPPGPGHRRLRPRPRARAR